MKIDILKATGLVALIGGGLYFYNKSKKSKKETIALPPTSTTPILATPVVDNSVSYTTSEISVKALDTIAKVNKILEQKPIIKPSGVIVSTKGIDNPTPAQLEQLKIAWNNNTQVNEKNNAYEIKTYARKLWKDLYQNNYVDLKKYYSTLSKDKLDKLLPLLPLVIASFLVDDRRSVYSDKDLILMSDNGFGLETIDNYIQYSVPTFWKYIDNFERSKNLLGTAQIRGIIPQQIN